MRVMIWAHLLYVGVWSANALFTSGIGLVRGVAFSSTAAVLHIALGSVGITAFLLAAWGKRAFTWLLVAWWIPQLLQVTIYTMTPTYPQNVATPIFQVAASPQVCIGLHLKQDVDKSLWVGFNVIAVIGIILAFVAAAKLYQYAKREGTDPALPADTEQAGSTEKRQQDLNH